MLNSSLLEQSPVGAPALFQGQGFIGDRQLDEVASRFNWAAIPPGRTVRIVVLHHHLLSGLYAEPAEYGANYSTVLDTGRFQQWLFRNRVDLVLHGHQHGWQVVKLSQPPYSPQTGLADDGRWPSVHVVGLGSAGVVAAERPPDVPNMFATLTFEGSAVTVDMWSIGPAQPSRPVQHVVLELATE